MDEFGIDGLRLDVAYCLDEQYLRRLRQFTDTLRPDFVLTDGNMTLDIDIEQQSIVKGDANCYCIGAASIIAKVERDALMAAYAGVYPGYGFERNAGYGTASHIAAIEKMGLTPIHRRSFTKKWQ